MSISIADRHRVALAGLILKADGPKGQLTAVVNTGYLDRQGDQMLPNCWSKCVREQQSPPLFWQHDYSQLPLGSVSHLQELRPGDPRIPSIGGKASGNVGALMARLNFSLDTVAGHDAFVLARDGHIKEFSVAVTNKREDESTSYEGVRSVKLVDEILELSLVVKGASLGTYTLEAKSAFSRLQSASLTRLKEQAYVLAFDRAFLKMSSAELRAAREEHRREAVREGLAVAVQSVKQSIARARQVQEVERRAGIEGNYWQVKAARPLTAEEARVREIQRAAGHV